jgi:O-antigen ligase
MTSSTLNYPLRVLAGHGGTLRRVLLVCLIGLTASLALAFAPEGVISWELLIFLFASTIFVMLLGWERARSYAKSFLGSALIIWLFLMVTEGIFVHLVTTNSAAGGRFDSGVYEEFAAWVLSFLALTFISLSRPAYIRQLFAGPFKWAPIFGAIALLSSPLSPVPSYSLALAFKLCVIILALCAILQTIENDQDVLSFFSALMVGTLIVTIARLILPFVEPGSAFEDGRLNMVAGLSGTAGILLILGLMFFMLKRNPWFLSICGLSLVAMALAGGKGGIAASIISITFFFALLKKARHAVVVLSVFVIFFAIAITATPLGQYMQNYNRSGEASSLTGRTRLWDVVWPAIVEHPVVGHGYRASRFLSAEVEGAFTEAGHTHNSFLEVLYNNGLVGLLPVLMMNWIIITNLLFALKRPTGLSVYFVAAAGAIYVQLLIWGLSTVTFAGMPDSRFMTFLFVLAISIVLRKVVVQTPEDPSISIPA